MLNRVQGEGGAAAVEENRNSLQKRQARYEAILQELTMMSDMLARNVLKDPACAAYVLQVILHRVATK